MYQGPYKNIVNMVNYEETYPEETLTDAILEILGECSFLTSMINDEVRQRFPSYDQQPKEVQDEMYCVVQIMTWKKFLSQVV